MAFDSVHSSALAISETVIPGLLVITLAVHGDSRGWFKENYQRAKMEALGLPHFESIQNNISFNSEAGVVRGLHAEPWEKYISVATGSVFAAWVDLRKGPGFGKVLTLSIDPGKAVFVPRGIANGYQTLEPNVAYTYLVNQHWQPGGKYLAVNVYDPDLAIDWPIASGMAIISDKDKANPLLKEVSPLEFL